MKDIPRLTPQTVAVIRHLLAEPTKGHYGREIGKVTGLKTGTLHPILARLEQCGMVESYWEEPAKHEDAGRPRRRYYRFTDSGAEDARIALASMPSASRATVRSLRPQLGQ